MPPAIFPPNVSKLPAAPIGDSEGACLIMGGLRSPSSLSCTLSAGGVRDPATPRTNMRNCTQHLSSVTYLNTKSLFPLCSPFRFVEQRDNTGQSYGTDQCLPPRNLLQPPATVVTQQQVCPWRGLSTCKLFILTPFNSQIHISSLPSCFPSCPGDPTAPGISAEVMGCLPGLKSFFYLPHPTICRTETLTAARLLLP